VIEKFGLFNGCVYGPVLCKTPGMDDDRLQDQVLGGLGSKCFLRNSFSCSRVLGSLCRFLYGGVPVGCVDAETNILQTLGTMNESGDVLMTTPSTY